jgi:hypothetical protein
MTRAQARYERIDARRLRLRNLIAGAPDAPEPAASSAASSGAPDAPEPAASSAATPAPSRVESTSSQ